MTAAVFTTGWPERAWYAPPTDTERTHMDRIALALATALGAGYAPLAPGTFG